MKTFILTFLVMLAAAVVFAQPDPRDSVILESKTVTPGTGGAADTSAYLYVKVYVTNKDSLAYMALSLLETSTSGRAYAILGWPRSFLGAITPLTPSLRYGSSAGFAGYHSNSPDSFMVGAGWDGGVGETSMEPPNATRKAVWEIKFDSVWGFWGTFALDTVSSPNLPAGAAQFTNTVPQDMPVNFVKSTILVAQPPPDPRDSVILESKTVMPGNGHPYTTVTVYLTNKDSLSSLTLPLIEKSTSGGAYATLPNPRTYSGVIRNLTPSLRYGSAAAFHYNSSSPDTFLVAAMFDPSDRDNTLEPPNAVRKAVWEIKFDTVLNNPGTFELDSCTFLAQHVTFTNAEPRDMPANFVKSVVTVALYPKGDLNQDLALSPADVVWILNCVMLGPVPPGGTASCDLNCDGMGTAADVVLELNAVFAGQGFPC